MIPIFIDSQGNTPTWVIIVASLVVIGLVAVIAYDEWNNP